MNKRIALTRSKYRALLSEVLPYELPLIFSNDNLYLFAQRYSVKIDEDGSVYTKDSLEYIDTLLKLLSGTVTTSFESYLYVIRKSTGKDVRKLTLIHPLIQFRITDFYEKYKELIVYFCQKSNYSIRYPYKEAQYMRRLQRYLPSSMESNENLKEEQGNMIKHFFVYKRYQNINGFFEDYRYQRAEKKFSHMLRTDLEHCFDNINPRQLSYAIFGIESKNTIFAKIFTDIQLEILKTDEDNSLNDKIEQSGIVIGPEFSRIFAELILQEIDQKVELYMRSKQLYMHSDYEFYRYVDDGFLFYSDLSVRTSFMTCYIDELSRWGLKLSRKKIKHFPQRPFFEKVTIAKRDIQNSLEKMFENRLNTLKGITMAHSDWYDIPYKVDSRYIIQDIKTALIENDVNLCDVASKLLIRLQCKLIESIKEFNNLYEKYLEAEKLNTIDSIGRKIIQRYEVSFVEFGRQIIDICFYIFNCDLRMSNSIKVVTIMELLIQYITGKYSIEGCKCHMFSKKSQMIFYKSLHDELKQVLSQNKYEDSTSLEIANLMLLQRELPLSMQIQNYYWEKYFNVDENERLPKDLNFMVVLSMLHIFQQNSLYYKLVEVIKQWILEKLEDVKEKMPVENSTEGIYLVISLLTAPFLDNEYKKLILDFTTLDEVEKKQLVAMNKKIMNIFVKWKDFDLFRESKRKSSPEVY